MIKTSIQFSVPISDMEKEKAKKLRDSLTTLDSYMEDFLDFFNAFFESLEGINSGSELVPIGDLLVRYKFKLRDKFNNCIRSLSLVIVAYNELFQESKTDNIRDVILAHYSEIRTDFIALLSIMSDYSKDTFVEEGKEKYSEISGTMEKVLTAIREEWIAHIDKNILGKIKLSNKDFCIIK